MLNIILKRFLKGFVSGGIASVAALIGAGTLTVSNMADLKNIAIMLSAAFISGGLLAIEKLLNYEVPQVPQDVQN